MQPRSRSRRMSARTSRRPSGSSPDIGSSRMTSSGSLMSAWAMPTRCSMPLENLRSGSRRSRPMPTSSSSDADAPAAVGGADTEQTGVVGQQLFGRQMVVEVRLLGQVTEAAFGVEVARRASRGCRASPEVGNTSCSSSFSVVVFPAPFGPRKPNTSPGSTLQRKAVEDPPRPLPPEADGVVLGQLDGFNRGCQSSRGRPGPMGPPSGGPLLTRIYRSLGRAL